MDTIFQFLDDNLMMIYLLLFTIILGFEIISKVPTVLHTPLMSGANAISGVYWRHFADSTGGTDGLFYLGDWNHWGNSGDD